MVTCFSSPKSPGGRSPLGHGASSPSSALDLRGSSAQAVTGGSTWVRSDAGRAEGARQDPPDLRLASREGRLCLRLKIRVSVVRFRPWPPSFRGGLPAAHQRPTHDSASCLAVSSIASAGRRQLSSLLLQLSAYESVRILCATCPAATYSITAATAVGNQRCRNISTRKSSRVEKPIPAPIDQRRRRDLAERRRR